MICTRDYSMEGVVVLKRTGGFGEKFGDAVLMWCKRADTTSNCDTSQVASRTAGKVIHHSLQVSRRHAAAVALVVSAAASEQVAAVLSSTSLVGFRR